MKPNYQRYYVKYMIKKPILFYSFLFLGVVGFIFGSMNIQMDIRKSYPAVCEDVIQLKTDIS